MFPTTTMQRDHAAFLSKRQANPSGREAREDTLAVTVEKIGEGITAFKAKHRDEIAQLRSTVDRLETKLSRPGVLAGPGSNTAAAGDDQDRERIEWSLNGKSVRVLYGADQLRSYYDERASSDSGERGGDGFGVSQRFGLGDFLRAVAKMDASPEARAAVSVGSNADGGYAVPTALMGSVLAALVPESSVLRAGVGVLPLEGFEVKGKSWAVAAIETVPTAAWRLESGNVTESSPSFRAVTLTPRSLSFYVKVTREWLADAYGVDQALPLAIAQSFALALDRAALLGSGTAPEPTGLLNTPGVIAVGNGANGASLVTTKWANFFTAVQAMLEANAGMPSAAIMAPRSLVTLGSLADTTGQPLMTPELLSKVRMLSTPQVPTNTTTGTSTDTSRIFLGDWKRSVLAMRERMSIQVLNETFATTGEIGFMCHARADFGVLYPKAFAVISGVRP